MHIIGTEPELAAAATQLQEIHDELPDALFVGRVGRAAIYNDLSYADAPELDLHDAHDASGFRGFDLVFASDGDALMHGRSLINPRAQHPVRLPFSAIIEYVDDQPMLWGHTPSGMEDYVPLQPEVVRPVERELLGVPVRTLPLGTQVQLEWLRVRPYGTSAQQAHDIMELALFAERRRDTHPEEFLDPEYYQPFVAYRHRHLQPA